LSGGLCISSRILKVKSDKQNIPAFAGIYQ